VVQYFVSRDNLMFGGGYYKWMKNNMRNYKKQLNDFDYEQQFLEMQREGIKLEKKHLEEFRDELEGQFKENQDRLGTILEEIRGFKNELLDEIRKGDRRIEHTKMLLRMCKGYFELLENPLKDNVAH
jgi:chromosome segregation ATPase